jgi:cation transport regulator ChaC
VEIAFGSPFEGECEQGVVYRASESNEAFLGPAPMEEMAEQINRCVGPSGSNREYVVELARALRGMGVVDGYVFEVEGELTRPTKR